MVHEPHEPHERARLHRSSGRRSAAAAAIILGVAFISGCNRVTPRPARSFEDYQVALIRADTPKQEKLEAADFLVRYYAPVTVAALPEERLFWIMKSASVGSATGAQGYAMELARLNRCREAMQWYAKSDLWTDSAGVKLANQEFRRNLEIFSRQHPTSCREATTTSGS